MSEQHPIKGLRIDTFSAGPTFSMRVTCAQCGLTVEAQEQHGSQMMVRSSLIEQLNRTPCPCPEGTRRPL